jgi:hypothetical protein
VVKKIDGKEAASHHHRDVAHGGRSGQTDADHGKGETRQQLAQGVVGRVVEAAVLQDMAEKIQK